MAWMASTRLALARAAWPTSMQKPMRGSRSLMALSTSKGEGKNLSSGPWLWMAILMSYSLTKRLDPLEGLGGGIAGDDDVDAGALGVFELAADVGLVVLGK